MGLSEAPTRASALNAPRTAGEIDLGGWSVNLTDRKGAGPDHASPTSRWSASMAGGCVEGVRQAGLDGTSVEGVMAATTDGRNLGPANKTCARFPTRATGLRPALAGPVDKTRRFTDIRPEEAAGRSAAVAAIRWR